MALKFRRGTTAQKSGSLAFGEPYVNTTLGTLQIGLDTGDVTLSAVGTGSNLVVGGISGSSLDITGNAKIDGNLTLGGNITIGDQSSDVINVVANLSSSLIPSQTNAFDLGSNSKIWRDLYISTGSIKFVDGTTVVKTLNLSTLNALDAATGSSTTAITNLNSFTASENSKFSTLATLTGSYDGRFTTLGTLTGSYDSRFTTLATTTGSLNTSVSNLNSTTASLNTSVTNLNSTTASLNTSVSNINSYTASVSTSIGTLNVATASLQTTSASVNTSITNINSTTASLNTSVSNLNSTTASLNTSVSNINTTTASLNTSVTNINSFTSSENSKFSTLATLTGSYDSRFTTLGTYTGSVDSRFTTLATLTGSYDSRFTTLGTYTGSVNTSITNINSTTASLNTSVSSINSKTGSYATTGSNIFTATQIISASLYITNDLVVYGSSSIQNITASQVQLGTNTILLNTATPSIRFAGIKVIDSGSSALTGSLLWDSQNNVWLYQNPSGSGYVSAKFISGPQNSGSLGSEAGLTTGKLQLAVGDDHIADSIATQATDNSKITIAGGLDVTGNISGSITGIGNVAAFSQSVGTSITNLNSTTASLNTSVTNLNSTTASLNTSVSNINTFTASENSKFSTLATLTGSYDSRFTTLGTTTASYDSRFTTLATYTGSVNTSITNINSTTASLNTSVTNLNSTTASLNTSVSNLNSYTSSFPSATVTLTNKTLTTPAISTVGGDEGGQIDFGLAATNQTLTGSVSFDIWRDRFRIFEAGGTSRGAFLQISSASAGVGSEIITNNGTQTLTNKTISGASNTISNIGNTSLTNSSITIAGTSTSLGGSITLATITAGSGIFSGSSQIPNSSITNAQLANSTISGIALGSNLATLTIGTGLSGTSYNGSGAVTIANSGVTSFNTRTGAVTLAATDIGSLAAGIVSGSSISSPAQGQVTLTTNGTAATAVNLGLQTTSSPTFAGLTINGAITATGDITAYYSSDKRFKDSVVLIEDALGKVRKLRGVKWEWNDTASEVTKAAPNTGLIAQEVQEVLPEVVKEREDGYLGLDYAKMVGLLVEAIKEQQLQIEKLQLEIQGLKIQKGL